MDHSVGCVCQHTCIHSRPTSPTLSADQTAMCCETYSFVGDRHINSCNMRHTQHDRRNNALKSVQTINMQLNSAL